MEIGCTAYSLDHAGSDLSNVVDRITTPASGLLAVVVLWAMSASTLAQELSMQRVRGRIDQCRAVQIIDRQRPIDSLRVSPPLRDPGTSAVLICMVGTFPVESDSADLFPTNDVGRRWNLQFLSITDTLVVIEPVDLDSAFLSNVYQIVIPIAADTITVDSLVTTRPWNGTSGGVILLSARNQISFVNRGTLDVSGLGFAGGLRSRDGGSCGLSIPCDGIGSTRTGGKGASALLPDPQCASGHQPWASGGGGGDAHNAGGGGGGNGGRGGRGGNQFVCSSAPGMWGVPGLRWSDDALDCVLFGGGGGGGHQNNSVATDGAAGGGIILLRTPTIIGDTINLLARGTDVVRDASNDGAGGGGAGGGIMIEACSVRGLLRIDCRGGRGGNAASGHGPGGGGGGGRVIVHPSLLQWSSPSITTLLSGGAAGTITSDPGNRNGAQAGEAGRLLPLCQTVHPHVLSFPRAVSVGDTLSLVLTAADTTAFCPCTVTHSIALDGSSILPFTEATQVFGDVIVSTSNDGETLNLRVDLPNTSSFSLPVRTILAADTIGSLRAVSRLDRINADKSCVYDTIIDQVTITTCGHSLRQVEAQTSILRVTTDRSSLDDVVLTITAPLPIVARVRAYSSVGQCLYVWPTATSSSMMNTANTTVRIDCSSWPSGAYYLVVETNGGSRTIPFLR